LDYSGTDLVGVGYDPGVEQWQAVDRVQNAVLRVAEGGGKPQILYRIPMDVNSAARLPCGWFVHYWPRGRKGRPALALIGNDGRQLWSKPLPWEIQGGEQAQGPVVTVTAGANVVAVGSVLPPFQTGLADCSGEIKRLRAAAPLPSGDDQERRWIGLQTVVTPSGLVTTFSDLMSDRRVIRRRDFDGRILGEEVVDVPMAIVARGGGDDLLAIRKTDLSELVVYSPAYKDDSKGGH
jgi:hypothetical protein